MSKRILCAALILSLVACALGQAGTVKEIIVTGNKQVTKEAILAAMATKVGLPYLPQTLDEDKRTLEELGFFQAVDTQAQPDGDAWKVVVNVSEFAVIKEIRILGNTVVSRDEIINALPLKQGQIFNARLATPAGRAVTDLYSKKGYFASVEDLGPLEASPEVLNISILEYKVNSIRIIGLTKTKEHVVKRLMKTKPGQIYNIRQWEKDVGRVFYSTQWFEDVKVDVQPAEDLGTVDLIVNVKEGRTGNFNVGLQLDPRSSFAGVIRLSDTNFRGSGQSVGVNYLQATTGGGASIDLDYSNPVIDNRGSVLNMSGYSRLVYRFSGGFGSSNTPTDEDRYTERRTGASIGYTRPIRGENLYTTFQLRAENITTQDLSTNNANNFIQQDGDLIVLPLGLLMNNRDVDLDPSRGNWAKLLIEPGYSNITKVGGQTTGNSILGSSFFFRNSLEYRQYISSGPPRGLKLDDPRRVFAFRARIGSISGDVPFFEQFFVGGADTLRGYAEDRFWGRNFATFTAEYRHPIQKAFNVIAFVDYGGAWGGYGSVNKFSQSENMKLHVGYGLGVSFRTPLGPIRIDFGFNENGGSRTHLLIGTSF